MNVNLNTKTSNWLIIVKSTIIVDKFTKFMIILKN